MGRHRFILQLIRRSLSSCWFRTSAFKIVFFYRITSILLHVHEKAACCCRAVISFSPLSFGPAFFVACSASGTAIDFVRLCIIYTSALARVRFAIPAFMDLNCFITAFLAFPLSLLKSFSFPLLGSRLWTQLLHRFASLLLIETLPLPSVSLSAIVDLYYQSIVGGRLDHVLCPAQLSS